MMMCHYIHQYYNAELEEREDVEVVGLGCCFLACKALLRGLLGSLESRSWTIPSALRT